MDASAQTPFRRALRSFLEQRTARVGLILLFILVVAAIGADVFAEYDGKKLGKPITPQKAKQMLTLLSGKTHLVYTGYCIIDAKNGKKKSGVVVTKVTFRKLAREEIDAYVATKEPLAVAGAYAIQKGAASFCTKVVGDYYAIVGFPLSRIVEELRDFGISAD